MRKTYFVIGVSVFVALSFACGRQSAAPMSPTTTRPIVSVNEVAGANVAPLNDVVIDGIQPTLVCQPVTASNSASVPVAYDWEVYDSANTKVRTEVVNGTSWAVLGLNYEQRYTWRVRATASYVGTDGNAVLTFGPWSTFGSFITPQNQGYIRGNELYDPLFNGQTVGAVIGPAHFVPGVGISLDS